MKRVLYLVQLRYIRYLWFMTSIFEPERESQHQFIKLCTFLSPILIVIHYIYKALQLKGWIYFNGEKLIIYLHSRTWRFTWAVSNCDGSHVYVPESESWAFFIVSVLIVVPSAICSGGVVWSLLPPIAVNLFLCLEWGI